VNGALEHAVRGVVGDAVEHQQWAAGGDAQRGGEFGIRQLGADVESGAGGDNAEAILQDLINTHAGGVGPGDFFAEARRQHDADEGMGLAGAFIYPGVGEHLAGLAEDGGYVLAGPVVIHHCDADSLAGGSDGIQEGAEAVEFIDEAGGGGGEEGAFALSPEQDVLLDQCLDGAAHGDAAEAVALGEFLLGGDLLALSVVAQQILSQPVAELLVQGAGAFAAEVVAGALCFGRNGQDRFPDSG
jgi:hypothetical protein